MGTTMSNRELCISLVLALTSPTVARAQLKTIRDAVTGRQLEAVELNTKRADCRVGDGRVWIATDRGVNGPKAIVSAWVFRPPLDFGDPPIVLRGEGDELLILSDRGRWQRRGTRLEDAPSFQFHETIGKQEHAVYGISFADLDTLVNMLENGKPTVFRLRGGSGRCDLRVVPERTDLLRDIMSWARDTAATH